MESPSNSLRESVNSLVNKAREGPRHVRLSRSTKDADLVLFGDDLTVNKYMLIIIILTGATLTVF